ncbi:hypothetical protein [Clostridium weizhouense]|uniref:Cell wall-binding protein n=1 Tax=Clostridium weizhouense TaxID=2859781 RepID=A0ABS7ALQ2_9CLOT|nr:hypothetical protein [Clostridium weizhouense]MBW6409599.1 hypothetical protein [Clostridium weizhouense]
MKSFKKLILALFVFYGIALLNPVKANAAWRQNSTGWWYTEGNSCSTGWKLINGNWYYFYPDGYMAHDTIIDGYYLNSSGAWTNGVSNRDFFKAEQKVKEYLANNGKRIASRIEYDHMDEKSYVIHCYDIVKGHAVTSGWYYVDKSNGNVKSMF